MKLRAFTYQEILITLTISTVVVLMSLVIYKIINHQFQLYRYSQKQLNDYYMFDLTMNLDFEKSDSARLSDNKLTIYRKHGCEITYIIEKDIACRKVSAECDTFHIDITEIIPFFEVIQNKRLLYGYKFKLLLADETILLSYYKLPEAYFLMDNARGN